MEILKRIVLLVFMGLAGQACVKEATIKLPPSENRLVLTSFISPDDSVLVAVIKNSKPRLGAGSGGSQISEMNSDEGNATITITGANGSCALIFDPVDRFYKGRGLKILEGSTYHIEASTPDGRKVTASTTVPQGKLTMSSFEIRITSQDSGYINYEADLQVNDIEGTTYMCAFSKPLSDQETPFTFGFYDQTAVYDTDEKTAKTRYTGTFFGYMGIQFASGITIPAIKSAVVHLGVLNTNKEFYLYHQSAETSAYSGNSPFGDPALVYTNINNGFGCFGAYTATFYSKKIR